MRTYPEAPISLDAAAGERPFEGVVPTGCRLRGRGAGPLASRSSAAPSFCERCRGYGWTAYGRIISLSSWHAQN
jgi:hypothetical protein